MGDMGEEGDTHRQGVQLQRKLGSCQRRHAAHDVVEAVAVGQLLLLEVCCKLRKDLPIWGGRERKPCCGWGSHNNSLRLKKEPQNQT